MTLDADYVEVVPMQRLTISAESMPLMYFLRWVSDQTGISVVADVGLDTRPVTVDVVDTPVDQVLSAVARRLDSQVTRVGGLYYIGDLRPEDRGVLVRKVVRLDQEGLTQAVSVLLSEHGRVQAFPDGLVLVGDRVEILQRVDELLDGIETAPIDSWVVQLYLVSMTRAASREFGFDVVPVIELSATMAAASASGSVASAVATGGLQAVLHAAARSANMAIVAQPLFVLVDGATASIDSVRQLPIVTLQRERSGGVTVEVEDVEYLPVGLRLEVSLREVGGGRAVIDLSTELSSVLGELNGQPIKAADTFDTRAVLASGGVYLLGSLERSSLSSSVQGPLQSVASDDDEAQTMQVWARAYRIGGPVVGSSEDMSGVRSQAAPGSEAGPGVLLEPVPPKGVSGSAASRNAPVGEVE